MKENGISRDESMEDIHIKQQVKEITQKLNEDADTR